MKFPHVKPKLHKDFEYFIKRKKLLSTGSSSPGRQVTQELYRHETNKYKYPDRCFQSFYKRKRTSLRGKMNKSQKLSTDLTKNIENFHVKLLLERVRDRSERQILQTWTRKTLHFASEYNKTYDTKSSGIV